MIVLSREPGGPSLYQQLYRQLRGQIARGELQAGQKLPAKRAMAQQLNISVNTVDGAYRQLESEGYIAARPRSGFYVCQIEALAPHSTAPAPTAAAPVRAAPVAVDFSPGGIAAEKFPLRRWQQLLRACVEGLQILSRTPAAGDPALRSAICQYIFEARGVRCTPAQMILGAGTDSLLQRLSYLLPNRCAFAVENPVYNQAYRLFARMGHPVVPVEIDHSGVTVEKLEQLDEAVVYTTPSHQYPLGLCMPMARRAQLLNWCSRGAFRYVIEDDYDSEFRYDSRPVPSRASTAAGGSFIWGPFPALSARGCASAIWCCRSRCCSGIRRPADILLAAFPAWSRRRCGSLSSAATLPGMSTECGSIIRGSAAISCSVWSPSAVESSPSARRRGITWLSGSTME